MSTVRGDDHRALRAQGGGEARAASRMPGERNRASRRATERWSASPAARRTHSPTRNRCSQQLCRRVELIGPMGAGASMKLAANLLLTVFWQALAEACSLLHPVPIAPETTDRPACRFQYRRGPAQGPRRGGGRGARGQAGGRGELRHRLHAQGSAGHAAGSRRAGRFATASRRKRCAASTTRPAPGAERSTARSIPRGGSRTRRKRRPRDGEAAAIAGAPTAISIPRC